jgi:hypothetical protein
LATQDAGSKERKDRKTATMLTAKKPETSTDVDGATVDEAVILRSFGYMI